MEQSNRFLGGGKFRFENLILGQGGFGKVHLGIEVLTRIPVAIKEINLEEMRKDNPNFDDGTIKDEIIVMRKCSEVVHHNLTRIIDYYIEPDRIYIVIELC